MRKITITPALNGWKVKVGCGEVVFNDKDEMLQELSNYIRDPATIEKRFMDNAVNKQLVSTVCQPEATTACAEEPPPLSGVDNDLQDLTRNPREFINRVVERPR